MNENKKKQGTGCTAVVQASQTLACIRITSRDWTSVDYQPHPVSDPVDVCWDARVCNSNKLPGDACAAGLGLHFENHCCHEISFVNKALLAHSNTLSYTR